MNKKLFRSFICLFLFSLTISGCNEKDEPQKEEPRFLELNKTVLVFEPESGSQNIMVSSNEVWVASSEADWFTVSPQFGAGNVTVTVTVIENAQPHEEREAALTFSNGRETVMVQIAQRANFLELDTNTLNFASEGGSQNIAVSSNGNWTVSGGADWLTVSPQSGEGNATVTVITTESMRSQIRTAVLTFSVGTKSVMADITQEKNENPQGGVVINGVEWATRNVNMPGTFAETPEDVGMFYQWGRNIGWSFNNPMINSNGGTEWDSSHYTGDTWTRANNPCPPGWRVPTHEEFVTLVNSGSQWTTVNGVNGRQFGTTPNTIFLPASGWRNSSGIRGGLNINGLYWSSTLFTSGASMRTLPFSSTGVGLDGNSARAFGLSVRCVAE